MPANSILIVEDDGILCANMEDMLTSAGYRVTDVLSSGEAALELVKEMEQGARPDLIIMDINLAGSIDGITATEQIKKMAHIPVIYTTSYTDDALIRRARETVPHAFLVKPVHERELIATIEMVLHRHNIERKLKETESALQYQFQFEKMVAQITSTFVTTATDKLDSAFDHALQLIGQFFNIDRNYIFQFYPDGKTMHNTHQWCAPGITPQPCLVEKLNLDALPWWAQQIRNHDYVYIPDVELLPPEAATEKEMLKRWDVQTIIAVPITINSTFYGFLGLESVRGEKNWTTEQVAWLRVVTDNISSALVKQRSEQALRESEARYREEKEFSQMLLDNSPAFIVGIDFKGKTQLMNQALLDALEYTAEEIKDTDYIATFIPEGEREMLAAIFQDIYRGKEFSYTENKIISKSGKTYLVEWHSRNYQSLDSRPDFFMAIGIDISARKRAEEALLESNKKLKNLVEQTSDWVWEMDTSFRFTYSNQRAEEIIGYTPLQLTEKTLFELMKRQERKEARQKLSQAMERQERFTLFNNTMEHRRGHPVFFESSGIPFFDHGGTLKGYRGISRDISARKEAAEEAMRVEALKAMENERMRLARELHDEMGMLLYSLKLNLQLLGTHLPAKAPKLQSRLQESVSLIDDSISAVRHKTALLRSPSLDTLGLRVILENMVDELGQRTGMKTRLQIDPGEPGFSPEIETTLFRCIQEALTNAARHSFAANLSVKLGWNKKRVSCMIVDDGIGFDSGDSTGSSSGHLGLQGMKERVFLLTGTIEIDSVPGKGTRIYITIPL